MSSEKVLAKGEKPIFTLTEMTEYDKTINHTVQ